MSEIRSSHFTIPVKGYDVVVGPGLRSRVAEIVLSIVPASLYVLLTDRNVDHLHGSALRACFDVLGLRVLTYVLEPGEGSKQRAVKAKVEDWMIENRCLRDSCIIALGGGVVGDLAGFIAATYMRGIPFVQIPTSFLAMVDSSIGGKTGIDSPNGKNLIGAIWQPKVVLIDPEFLATLPDRHLCNGIAEAIKAGAICDSSLFELLELYATDILTKDIDLLCKVIQKSVAIKADVVRKDERENGMRAILNFGHSIGHAIEALLGLEVLGDGELLHGEAISIGMVLEATLARTMGYLHTSSIRRLVNCLQSYKLPVKIPHGRIETLEILEKMSVDKKNTSGSKKIVILTEIGKVLEDPWTTAVSDEQLLKLLSTSTSIIPGIAIGSLAVPGSKSVSNRILLLAALGAGTIKISGLLHSEDTQVMLDSLRKLGVRFRWSEGGSVLTLEGCGGSFKASDTPLYLGNAGTASRMLTTAATLLKGGSSILTGNKRMQARPIGDLVDALRNIGCKIDYLGDPSLKALPISVHGSGFPGGEISLKADVSSQFVTSLLLSAPYANSPVILRIKSEKIVSEPYITMTLSLMADFGIAVSQPDPFTVLWCFFLSHSFQYVIPQGVYKNPPQVLVEGDASSASYPLAFAAITGGKVTVENVGTKSTQGDANFCMALKRMGCEVSQTPTSTTVWRDPSVRLKGIEIDMGDLTDTFMTLASVAAVAEGTTRITNIANQRVKECNRILAMVTEFSKIGIPCRELEDGIEIDGIPDKSPISAGEIQCYDDHRIAMSAAVLGSAVPGIIITDKLCVEKTYSEFWDHVEQKLNLKLDENRGDRSETSYNPSKSLFLIGMRASGKTTLGKIASSRLNLQFHDLDDLVEKRSGSTIKEIVAESGWSVFRKWEQETLMYSLQNFSTGHLIACGGGIIETPQCLAALKRHSQVVFINRQISDIEDFLSKDTTRPSVGESVRDIWSRRLAKYFGASNFEFFVRSGDVALDQVADDFTLFVQRVMQLRVSAPLHTFPSSNFLSLTYSNFSALVDIKALLHGVDAVEFRVDLLESHEEEFVKEQYSLLRRQLCMSGRDMPVIFTVRSTSQGGKFANDEDQIVKLLKIAVRLASEYVDFETSLSWAFRNWLIRNRNVSYLIASYHYPSSNGGSTSDISEMFRRCAHSGKVQVAKVVISSKSIDDTSIMLHAVRDLESSHEFADVVILGLAMGEAGKLTRILSRRMTPVTSSFLASAAASGQLTLESMTMAKNSLGLGQPPLRFFLFGKPIVKSPSPALHNSGFQVLNVPFTFSKVETDSVDAVLSHVFEPDFGGASITVPLKEHVFRNLTCLSQSAREIGAVNTIFRDSYGNLVGDNTDWIGLRLLLQSCGLASAKILVVGGGGTARAAVYASKSLNADVYIHNRTREKAELLASEFKCFSLPTLEDEKLEFNVIINTVVSSVNWKAPDHLLRNKPVIIDANYLPKVSALHEQAVAHKCRIFRGIDMLLEQGYCQFELWTHRRAPRQFIARAVQEFYKNLE